MKLYPNSALAYQLWLLTGLALNRLNTPYNYLMAHQNLATIF